MDLTESSVLAARNDVNLFIEMVYGKQTDGKPFRQAPFHREWQRLIDAYASTVIATARGFGGSIQLAGRIVFTLGHNPDARVKIVSAHETGAVSLVNLIGDLIRSSRTLHQIFPKLYIDDEVMTSKGQFTVVRERIVRDPSVYGADWRGNPGGRTDLLVLDGVDDCANALLNPALREEVKNTIKCVWLPSVASDGKVVMLGTPYHEDDTISTLGADFEGQWEAPALNRWGRPLWPEWWDEEKLAQKKRVLGPNAFDAHYMLKVMTRVNEEQLLEEKRRKNRDHC